jgi:ribosome-interacting GTPase 1
MYEDVGFQLVDLPPVTPDYNEHWLFDAYRRADMVWLVLSTESLLSGYELVHELLEQKRIHLYPAFSEQPEELDWAWVPQPTLLVITGSDLPDAAENLEILRELVEIPYPVHLCSTVSGEGLEELRELTFRAADIIRIYTKQPGKDPDMDRPFTVPTGTTVEELAYRIHKDLARSMRSARIWGSGTFDGQTVNRNHVLQDRDVLELKA